MALTFDPIAREQLNEMRYTLGELYISAIWAQRGFEQQVRNAAALTQWRQSFPTWDRLFARPPMAVKRPEASPSAQKSDVAIIHLPNGRSGDSLAA